MHNVFYNLILRLRYLLKINPSRQNIVVIILGRYNTRDESRKMSRVEIIALKLHIVSNLQWHILQIDAYYSLN